VPDNNTLALCIICNKTIASRLSRLYRHAESEMLREKLEKGLEANKWNDNINLNTQTDESPLSFDERKKIAEIKYAALITEKKYFSSNCKGDSPFFSTSRFECVEKHEYESNKM